MTKIDNTEISKYEYAQMAASVASQFTSGNSTVFLNSIMTVLNPNADTMTKSMGMFQAIGSVFSALDNRVSAQQDVSGSKQRIEQGEQKVDEIKKVSLGKVQEKIDTIEAEMKKIQAELDKLDKNNKLVQEKQTKLDEEKEKINKAITILNNPKSDASKKKEALGLITSASNAIKALAAEVLALSAVMEASQAVVAESTVKIETSQAEATKEITESYDKIQAQTAQTAQEAGTNESYIAKGGTEVAAGEAEQAKAAASTWAAGVTAGAGALVGAASEKKALDLIAAGKEHISGGASNLTSLGAALGKMGESYSELAYASNAVGGIATEAASLIGSYQTKVAELVTSIGSWTNITASADELIKQTEEYSTQTQQTAAENTENSQTSNQKFEFDLNKLTLNNA